MWLYVCKRERKKEKENKCLMVDDLINSFDGIKEDLDYSARS